MENKFWEGTHEDQDKLEILRDKLPCGYIKNAALALFSMVLEIHSDLANNGSWHGHYDLVRRDHDERFGRDSYISDFLDTVQRDNEMVTELGDDEALDDRLDMTEDVLAGCLELAWDEVATEDDKKKVKYYRRQKEIERLKAEKAQRKIDRKRKREDKEEEKRLRKQFKVHTGKMFRCKKGSDPLKQLREAAERFPTPLVVHEEPDEPDEPDDPEPPKFAVTEGDWVQYKAFQAGGTMPMWFHTNDTKATEIMTKYKLLAAHYN